MSETGGVANQEKSVAFKEIRTNHQRCHRGDSWAHLPVLK